MRRKFVDIVEGMGLGGVMAWNLGEDSGGWGHLGVMGESAGRMGLTAPEESEAEPVDGEDPAVDDVPSVPKGSWSTQPKKLYDFLWVDGSEDGHGGEESEYYVNHEGSGPISFHSGKDGKVPDVSFASPGEPESEVKPAPRPLEGASTPQQQDAASVAVQPEEVTAPQQPAPALVSEAAPAPQHEEVATPQQQAPATPEVPVPQQIPEAPVQQEGASTPQQAAPLAGVAPALQQDDGGASTPQEVVHIPIPSPQPSPSPPPSLPSLPPSSPPSPSPQPSSPSPSSSKDDLPLFPEYLAAMRAAGVDIGASAEKSGKSEGVGRTGGERACRLKRGLKRRLKRRGRV